MKKVINGRRYDTEGAMRLAGYRYGMPRDLGYWEETLYRKRTGEFFLHGEGGPASKYAESIGMNQWSGSEKLIPLTVEAAKKWAEEHLDAEEYEKIFEIQEETGKKVVTFSLPDSIIEMIKIGAAEQNVSMSEYVAQKIKG